jgi:glycosyltransferase involved in cell wall biosynthesis
VFVDDSDDDTPARVREVAEQSRSVNIRLIHRVKKDRKGGLGGAVVAGFRSASTPWLAVMDGDLQHPPELLAQLLDTAQTTGADVVVASRYLDGGDGSALGGTRLRLSHSATKVARILFPHRLNAVTDPMSGFFVVRADAIDLDLLQPDGVKILVEILLRGRPLSVAEVGYRFGHRASGSSKASAREGTRYVTRLVGLRWQALLHNGGTR